MGLINWLKDKVVMQLEHDIRLMRADIEGINAQMETLRSQIASVRTMKRRKSEENEEIDSDTDLSAIRKAFGGDIPIEFSQRMKDGQ